MSKLSYYYQIYRKTNLLLNMPRIWNYIKYRSLPRKSMMSINRYTPQLASLILTKRCNLSCEFCSIGKKLNPKNWRDSEATLEKVQRIFTNPLFSNCLGVDLLGGEPLLVKDLHRIVSWFSKRGLFINLNTNGLSLHKHITELKSDGISRTLFRDWANYFELTEIDSDKLTKKKCAKKIIISTILELNTLDRKSYPIQKLVHDIAKKLDFSHSLIDFFSVFEIILRQIQSSDEETKAIEGLESARDEKSLPNFPKVSLLKINHTIQIDLVLKHVSEHELLGIINLGDGK